MSRVIDAHHHLWRYNATEYGWIDDSMAVLQRDFLAQELQSELRSTGVDETGVDGTIVDGTIAVQARQSLEETRWLLQIARDYPFIEGVVGWVPLTDGGVQAMLESLAADARLRGVRHVLQGEHDEYMLMAEFQRGVSLLARCGLAYDVLIHERQLPSAIQLVDRNPGQVFILDHIAKPPIRAKVEEPWGSLIRQLAERPNVYCKISGMVTEDNWLTWSAGSLQPYIDTVLEAFGASRLLYGSDWPVCLVASSYSRWIETVRRAIGSLSTAEQGRIMGGTAEEAYKLSPRKEND